MRVMTLIIKLIKEKKVTFDLVLNTSKNPFRLDLLNYQKEKI